MNVTSSFDVTPFAQSAHTDACCRLIGPRIDLTWDSAPLPLSNSSAIAPTDWWPPGAHACAARGTSASPIASAQRLARGGRELAGPARNAVQYVMATRSNEGRSGPAQGRLRRLRLTERLEQLAAHRRSPAGARVPSRSRRVAAVVATDDVAKRPLA